MLAHRFQEHLQSPAPQLLGAYSMSAPAAVPATAGVNFACLPFPMFSALSAAHQAQIREVYRVAAERTNEQLRRRWAQRREFSVN
jgi:hypothetical protein